MRKLFSFLACNILFFLLTPEPGLGQQPQIIHYERGSQDGGGAGRIPSFRGIPVAIRFEGSLNHYAHRLFSQLGVDDFIIIPSLAAEDNRNRPLPRMNIGAGGVPGQIMAGLIRGGRIQRDNGSQDTPGDPCNFPGHVFICLSITEPISAGPYRDYNSVWFSRRGVLQSTSGRQLQRYEVSVRADLIDSREGSEPIFTPLGVSSKMAFNGNNTSWFSSSDSRFGSWAYVDDVTPVNIGIKEAAKKGIDELLKKGKGWYVGAANAVSQAGR